MKQSAEWDFYTPEVSRDPFPVMNQAREAGDATWHEKYQAWVVGGYKNITSICRDERNFTACDGIVAHNFGKYTLLAQDGTIHRRLRAIWNAPFMPSALKALTPRIEQVCADLLDPVATAVADGDEVDIAPAIRALPVEIVRQLLGVPDEHSENFARWSDEITQMTGYALPPDHPVEIQRVAAQNAVAEVLETEIRKRREHPQDDLIGRIVASGIDAELGEQTLVDNCRLLLVAGNETTTNWIGNSVYQFDKHKAAQAELRNDRGLLPAALEETLRYDGVSHFAFRRAKSDDAMVGSVHIPKGDQIIMMYGAANRDPAQFPEPDRFDIHRKPDNHLGFGHSVHTCLGLNLARLEGLVFFNAFFDRIPAFKIVDIDFGLTFPLRGPVRLIIRKP